MTERPTKATLAVVLAMLVALSAALATVTAPVAAGSAVTGPGDAKTEPRTDPPQRQTQRQIQTGIQGCEYPFEYTDATGTTVTISEDPDTVVTMAPSAAQTMWEIGARDEVVGVSQFAYYLEGAREKANVSAPGFGKYNVERIVALEPDVVLAPNVVPDAAVGRIRDAGVTVVKFPLATSIEDVREKTRTIGRITGNCEGAADAVAWMDANLEAVGEAVADEERPSVLYLLGGGYTVGGGTFINDMITTAGARNIVAEANVSGYPEVNEELVVARDPEYLLVTAPDPPAAERAPYNSTTAVREGNVVVLNPNYLNQPAPRSVVYAVRNMTEQFHPEAFDRVEMVSRSEAATTPTPTSTPTRTSTATATPTPTETEDAATETEMTNGGATPTETETETETTSGGGLPGFGPVVALVAVLVATLALVRRRR